MRARHSLPPRPLTAKIPERLSVIEEQHRRDGSVGVVSAADVMARRKIGSASSGRPSCQSATSPIIVKRAGGFGVVASERGQARRGLLEGGNRFKKLPGTAIGLGQVHEDTQLQHLGSHWRDLQETLRSLDAGNSFRRGTAVVRAIHCRAAGKKSDRERTLVRREVPDPFLKQRLARGRSARPSQSAPKAHRRLGASGWSGSVRESPVAFSNTPRAFSVFILNRVLAADRNQQFHAICVVAAMLALDDVLRAAQQFIRRKWLARRRRSDSRKELRSFIASAR